MLGVCELLRNCIGCLGDIYPSYNHIDHWEHGNSFETNILYIGNLLMGARSLKGT